MTDPETGNSYDWFTFYLRTTYVCIIVTLWAMDQPKQSYKLITKKLDLSTDNFEVNKYFMKVHGFMMLSTVVFFFINIRTNYITHIVFPLEVVLFAVLIIANVTIYYWNFIRKKPALTNNTDQENQLSGVEIQSQIDDDNNKKTIKIILWIITLVTIGKIIVSPSYIFYANPGIIDGNPETYLFLDNINNELLLYLLVLILFSQLLTNQEFFPLSTSFSFNSFDELVGNFKNTFKIYVLNVIFLTFIASKTKSNFLFIVYLLCFATSTLNNHLAYKMLKQGPVYSAVNLDIENSE
ncbi:hypothetical protein DASC09_015630 [Saccharomycopsis crataegensis]|uniref:Uncharacterized protein n=1 Tax=Saccharomycopsis crataegensis TaxID=43959 RepID=A0AAV5QHI9_9ASCO|nr:hypothetical protein DASC09_015630 [Saccharomycopsis crataegensis]